MYNVYVENFMLREVKYIFYGMTYNQLKTVLKENKHLHSFPLVDNPDSMVLLGSIQRIPLIQLIEKHIGKEKRLQVGEIVSILKTSKTRKHRFYIFRYCFSCKFIMVLFQVAAIRQREAEEKARMEAEERFKRRPSRFQVIPAPDMLRRQSSENHLDQVLA